MYTEQPKKLMIINILDILRRYTDKNHRLSQKKIAKILQQEYHMKADRKAVKRNLMNLIDFGYDIEYSETIRMVPNAQTGHLEESYILSDFYLRREFDDSELRLLIDSLLFSKHIPYSQCKTLVEKLEGLSNIYFRSRVKHIATLPEDKADNKQIFLNIELLDEAITHNRKVVFKYFKRFSRFLQYFQLPDTIKPVIGNIVIFIVITNEIIFPLFCRHLIRSNGIFPLTSVRAFTIM